MINSLLRHYSQYLVSQSPRGILRQKHNLAPGDSINNFTVSCVSPVSAFGMTQIKCEYAGVPKYIHLDSDVTNNAMGIVFPSPSMNNHGTALAVQRMISACASSAYPVRDTMARMTENSLSRVLSEDSLNIL